MNINFKKNYTVKQMILIPLISFLSTLSLIIFTLINIFSKDLLKFTFHSKNIRYETFKINFIFLILFIIFFIALGYLVNKLSTYISKSLKAISLDTKNLLNSYYDINNSKHFNCIEIEDLNLNVQKLAKQLIHYHNSQQIVLANASHELRTPLMSIQGYAEGIKYDVFDNINDPLDIIIDESVHLKEVIQNILKLSKLDSYSLNIEKKELNVYSTLNCFANRLRGIAYSEHKTILIEGNKYINFFTDENLFYDAFSNIVSNALRYSISKIIISFKVIDNFIIIDIQDDGCGISENDLKHLFTRFYKGSNGNSGLGLSIAKSSIQYLGGEIFAFNTPTGACFRIKLHNNL